MKILMMTYEFPHSMDESIVSGEIKNPYHLVRGLMARGHDVTVLSVPFLTRSVRRAGFRPGSVPAVFDVPEGGLRSVARYMLRIRNIERALKELLRTQSFDVVHAQAPAFAAAALGARRRGVLDRRVRIVTTAHGTYVPEVEGDRAKRSIREILRTRSSHLSLNIDRKAFLESDAVIAASGFQEAEMLDLYRVPQSKLSIIYNGIDLDLYRPAGARAAFEGDAAGGDGKVILFVGRMVPKKGLQFLIEAFPSILQRVPDARCVVVGGSPMFDTFSATLKATVRERGLSDRFEWLQSVPESRMPSIYRRACVSVVPSINYESLPTVVTESMASGVPVVATNRWAIPEALGPGHPGLVPQASPAELASAVAAVLTDPAGAESMKQSQLARLGTFSLDTCVTRHEGLYSAKSAD